MNTSILNTKNMKVKAVIGIDGYSLMVCHCSGNLYHLSIIEQDTTVHDFEGIYSNLRNAIERGKSVIQILNYTKPI